MVVRATLALRPERVFLPDHRVIPLLHLAALPASTSLPSLPSSPPARTAPNPSMPSIFTRSSKPSKTKTHPSPEYHIPDEFGRVQSATQPFPPPKDTKKSSKDGAKDKDKGSKSARQRTLSSPAGPGVSSMSLSSPNLHSMSMMDSSLPPLPDGTFHPLTIPPKKDTGLHEYGYIGAESDVYLGLRDVERLVQIVSHELSNRGVWGLFHSSWRRTCRSDKRLLGFALPGGRRNNTILIFDPGAGRLI